MGTAVQLDVSLLGQTGWGQIQAAGETFKNSPAKVTEDLHNCNCYVRHTMFQEVENYPSLRHHLHQG